MVQRTYRTAQPELTAGTFVATITRDSRFRYLNLTNEVKSIWNTCIVVVFSCSYFAAVVSSGQSSVLRHHQNTALIYGEAPVGGGSDV